MMPVWRASTPRLAWLLLAAFAVGAGLFLRGQQLVLQVVLDDEWHALHKALSAGPLDIATHLGRADYSIPLTLYVRLLYEHGWLSELRMRAPMIAAGALTLGTLPWLVRDCTGRATRVVFLMLLAVSPLLVLYSRHARPYALTCLLSFVALVAFDRWWRRKGYPIAWAGAYVAATALAGWLSPVTLPFTLAPFVYRSIAAVAAAARGADRGNGRIAARRLVALAPAAAIPLALALVPAAVVDWTSLADKAGVDWVTGRTVWRALLLQFGVASPWIGAAMTALAIRGAVLFAREDASRAACFSFAALAGFLAIVAARPAWVHYPIVLARYMIPALPLLLLAVARGTVDLVDRLRPSALAPAAVAALGAALFFAGPLPGLLVAPTQFGAHLRYWFDFDPDENPYLTQQPVEPVPEFYRELAALAPGSRMLIEAPWRLESHYNPLALYQTVHRQRVRVGFVTPVCGSRTYGEYPEQAGLHMRNFAHLPALLRGETGGADYLVMHLASWTTPAGVSIEWPDVSGCLPAIERVLGPAIYRDGRIVVYPLKPERRSSR
jgi:hypothetical protein